MIFRLCRSVDCTERGGKQVTIMNKRNFKFTVLSPLIDFFSIIIECNINFTSSLGKISYSICSARRAKFSEFCGERFSFLEDNEKFVFQ